MYHTTIYWKLPEGAFYGTEQGRSLDKTLDDLIATGEDVSSLWHVVGPDDHWLFREEEAARRCEKEYNADRAATYDLFEAQMVEMHGPDHGHMNPLLEREPYRTYPHTRGVEQSRQQKLQRAFNAAAMEAKAQFARPSHRRCYELNHWWECLSPAAKLYGEAHGLLID